MSHWVSAVTADIASSRSATATSPTLSVPATRTLRILSPPTVTANCPAEGEVDKLLQFSANASDADGNIVLYEWDFNSPSGKLIGTPDFFDSAPEALKKYDLLPPNDAFYTAVVQVTDNDE